MRVPTSLSKSLNSRDGRWVVTGVHWKCYVQIAQRRNRAEKQAGKTNLPRPLAFRRRTIIGYLGLLLTDVFEEDNGPDIVVRFTFTMCMLKGVRKQPFIISTTKCIRFPPPPS